MADPVAEQPVLELNWGTIRSAGVADLFDIAAGTGFESVTITAWKYREALAAGTSRDELIARHRASGVAIGYLDGAVRGLPGMADEEGALKSSLEEAFRLAEDFGIRTFNVTHFGGAVDVDRNRLADAVGEMTARAATEGISIVFEFIPGTGVPDLASGVRLVQQVGAANLSLLFDTWHHWRSGGRLADLEALDPSLIGACQLADMPADRVDTFRADDPEAAERNARMYRPMTGRLLPGDGVLPLTEVCAWFATHRPELPWGAEVFSADLDAMAPEDAAAATYRSLLELAVP
ncbi:sugar phosphate isomerase/epimerase family protein [Enemella sp. A6]|uniref:sugar phosphate isomerase/epimerase family protein n=1 Tax=Enemella sp. A6 TaxID=3440152 RepID=UPI003EC052AD